MQELPLNEVKLGNSHWYGWLTDLGGIVSIGRLYKTRSEAEKHPPSVGRGTLLHIDTTSVTMLSVNEIMQSLGYQH